jgi:hypothetical protein
VSEDRVPYHVAVLEDAETPEQARYLLAEACTDYLRQRDEATNALLALVRETPYLGTLATHEYRIALQQARAILTRARTEGRTS